MINRRSFLRSILSVGAAGVAPYIITTPGLLMPIRKLILPPTKIILWGDSIHDDTAALQALIDGLPVFYSDGQLAETHLKPGMFLISGTLIGRLKIDTALASYEERKG